MTENGKKFLEQVSKDAALQAELQKAQGMALCALLKEKGLEDAAAKAGTEAMLKVASAHGSKLTAEDLKTAKLDSLSEDELKAVAGGRFVPIRLILGLDNSFLDNDNDSSKSDMINMPCDNVSCRY